jgi:hypothetical protein
MCDKTAQHRTEIQFIKMAREIADRIDEERYGEWWIGIVPLAFALEKLHRELFPQPAWPAFLIAMRIGDVLYPRIPRDWMSDPGAARILFDHSQEISDEGWLFMSDPVTGETRCEVLEMTLAQGRDVADYRRLELPKRHTADAAIQYLRRWARAVRRGTVALAISAEPSRCRRNDPASAGSAAAT